MFAPERKRDLPRFPERIAVVTSATGAAIRDILQTLRRRYPAVRVFVFDVRVQGDGAAGEVADAIRRINRNRERLGGIDVMIVGRGGGSLEDLWAFNEEAVARAIFASEIPVVSAVGHEVDFTIADFTADVRAATPTAAAELVVPTMDELRAEINSHAHRMTRGMRAALDSVWARLSAVERFEWFRDPVGRVRHRQQQVDEISGRLQLAISRGMGSRKTAVHELEVRLARVRPEAVLSKRRDVLSRIEQRLTEAQRQYNLRLERRLALQAGRLAAFSPIRLVEPASVAVEQFRVRLMHGLEVALSQRVRSLESMEARLVAGSHERILARGFSITRLSKTRKIVTDPGKVREGDRISTQTAGGEIESRVVDQKQTELFE
ncbi:MAG: exodeoxyribonuclease VII large subunit [Planctomycetota bacterium]|nr:exodeoxyribonuclease VII large subunit [Planctomycetota bacterium]